MEYKFYIKQNHEYLSAGHIIHQTYKAPNFPIKIIYETFARCLEYTDKKTNLKVYDCCSGNGYILTIIGFLFDKICGFAKLIGSDISESAAAATEKNLSLLTKAGLDDRMGSLRVAYEFTKPEYYEKLKESEKKLFGLRGKNEIESEIFIWDILKNPLENHKFICDVVICDVPYGDLVNWSDESGGNIGVMLENLIPVLDDKSVVSITSDKTQKIYNDKFQRLEKFQIGKRKTEILKLKNDD